MANTAANVSTGKPNIAGAVYVGTIGTATVPTDATTSLGSDFVCLGYVSEDGLENENDIEMSEVKEWGGAIVYRSLTQMTDNFKLALLESENLDVLKTVYGDVNVTESNGKIAIDIKAEDPQEKYGYLNFRFVATKRKE